MRPTYTKNQIKKFILHKQLLLKPREISGYDGIKTVFQSLRSLQYDPQSPCGRSIDISLQARVCGLHPSDYHQWLYVERKGIELYDKELCVIPVEDVTLRVGRFSPSRQKKLDGFVTSNKIKLDALLLYIKEKGPVCSKDIQGSEKMDIFWEPTRWSKVALDSLWKLGELVIVNRRQGRKYFDISTKIYGERFASSSLNNDQRKKEQIRRRIRGVGLLPRSGTGSGWLGIGTGREITPILEELIRGEEILEIEIGGMCGSYVINYQDVGLLDKTEELPFEKKVSFLSPLDNLLWDRKLILGIFGFNYKWEAYTPPEQRVYGHYVLPVLYGLDFIGRIEPKYNSLDNCLTIHGLWLEESTEWNEEISKAFFDYLDEFKTYLGAENILWLCEEPKSRFILK